MSLRLLSLLCVFFITHPILAQQSGTTKLDSAPETCSVTKPKTKSELSSTSGWRRKTRGHRPALIDDHFMIGVPVARAMNPISKANWTGTHVEPDVTVTNRKNRLSLHDRYMNGDGI